VVFLHFRELNEVLDLLNVAIEVLRAFAPEVVEEPLIWRYLAELPLDPLKHGVFGANWLVTETLLEKLIEVEIVLTQEIDRARSELLNAMLD
jgi:hypothetical protein